MLRRTHQTGYLRAGQPHYRRRTANFATTVEHVGVLGDAEVIPGTRQSEVRVPIGRGGGYIGVAGTLPPAELVDVARDLKRTTTP